jgi:hypothetical protein
MSGMRRWSACASCFAGFCVVGHAYLQRVARLYQALEHLAVRLAQVGQQPQPFREAHQRHEQVAQRGTRRLTARHLEVEQTVGVGALFQFAPAGESENHRLARTRLRVARERLLRIPRIAHGEDQRVRVRTLLGR